MRKPMHWFVFSVGILISVLESAPGVCHAVFRQSGTPHVRPEIIEQAKKHSSKHETLSRGTVITPEIQAVAQGLHNDPQLIYEFVRNTIDVNGCWGKMKGAHMTLMDGEGGPWDQSSLLVALLRSAGFTANYEFNWVEITADDFSNWFGVPPDYIMGNYLFEHGHDAFNIIGNPPTEVRFETVIVNLDIDGTIYQLDASYKDYEYFAGADIATAMGYDRTTFTANAAVGMTTAPDYIQNMNRANVRSDLAAMCQNLDAWTGTNMPAEEIRHILGGRRIIPVVEQPFETNLAHIRDWGADYWTEIPDQYTTTINFWNVDDYLGVPATDVYGHQFSLIFIPQGELVVPTFIVDGVVIDTWEPVSTGTQDIWVEFNHAYWYAEGTWCDDYGRIPFDTDTRYIFCMSLGYCSDYTLESQRKHLKTLLQQGYSPTSLTVVDTMLAMIGAAWMHQTSMTGRIIDPMAETMTVRHHGFGYVAYDDAVYMDIFFERDGVLPLNNNWGDVDAKFYAMGQTFSAMEWGAIDQTQDISAVSAVKLIDQAINSGLKMFNATDTNYFANVRPYLVNYDPDLLSTLDNQINDNFTLWLPERGDLTDGSYTGTAYYALDEYGGMGFFINGGLDGGYGNEAGDPDIIDQALYMPQNSIDHSFAADPVDLQTGCFVHSVRDLSVGAAEFPFGLNFTRTTNSGNRLNNGPLGLGWTHNWQSRLERDSDYQSCLGGRTFYDMLPAVVSQYVTMDLLRNGLELDRMAMAALINRWFMDSLLHNRMTAGGNGASWVFCRTVDGTWAGPPGYEMNLTEIFDGTWSLETGNGRTLHYDSDGRLTSITDRNANAVTLIYDNDRLTLVSNGLTTQLVFTYTPEGRLETVSDGTGRQVEYGYDVTGNLVSVTDPAMHVLTYGYDVPGRLERVYHPSDPVTPFLTNTFDVLDRVETQDVTGGPSNSFYYAAVTGDRMVRCETQDASGNALIYTYDYRGRKGTRVDAEGFVSTYEYDGLNRLVRTTEPEGNSLERVFDGLTTRPLQLKLHPKTGSMEPPRIYQITYDPVHKQIESVQDPAGTIVTTTYDADGNVDTITYPVIEGVVPIEDVTVNSRGQVTDILFPNGVILSANYDSVTGWIESVVNDAGGLNQTMQYEYDTVGNVSQVTDPKGYVTTYAYDGNRRLTHVTGPGPDHPVTTMTYNPDRKLTHVKRATGRPTEPWAETVVSYDLAGGIDTLTDEEGRQWSHDYNDFGKLSRIVDPLGNPLDATYDIRGNAYQLENAFGHFTETHLYTPNGRNQSLRDANDNTTQYIYDDFDRLRQIIYPDMTYEEMTYDAMNRMTGRTNRAGDIFGFTYNRFDLLDLKTRPDLSTVDYIYDGMSRLTTISDGAQTVGYSYDMLNRLVTETAAGGRCVGYAYDLNDNMTRMEWPDGYFVTYEYDSLNRLTAIRENGTLLLASYTYDLRSRRETMTLANGITVQYAYDDTNRVTWIYWIADGSPYEVNQLYTPLGDVQSVTVSDQGMAYLPEALGTTGYIPNLLNQYASVGGVGYSYDGNGNMTSDGVNTYGFDAENRLVSATVSGSSLVFTYDDLGYRTSKTVDGVRTDYLWSQQNLLAEYDHSGELQKRYIYEPGIDAVLMMKTATDTYFFHSLPGRSTVMLTSGTGTVVEKTGYSPYGLPTLLSGVGNPKLFSGREFDAETGLYYVRQRYYSPVLGRFISADPAGYSAGDTGLYAFVRNSPASFIDPDGAVTLPVTGGGYQGAMESLRDNYLNSSDPTMQKMGKELDLILDQLEKHCEAMKNKKDQGGNCVVSFRDLRSNGFHDPLRNLEFFEVAEIAAAPRPDGSYGHFGISISYKNPKDFSDVLFVFDPIRHTPGIPGQSDGSWRVWDERAYRNPSTWLEKVIGYHYGADPDPSKLYMGKDPNLVNNPYIPDQMPYNKWYGPALTITRPGFPVSRSQ
ncbi:hypothetical protein JXA80_00220 [bacterium]|nr:hypothetical protein [candidate division CSSED10-310 bacterium]